MIRTYGERCAKALMMRMSELSAAEHLGLFALNTPPQYCHALRGNRAGQYAMRLHDKYRLVFVPDHDPVPLHAHGGIDTTQVTAIRIIEVSEHYD
jgi:proteic killer suppression protein